jgi:hypothetical protein
MSGQDDKMVTRLRPDLPRAVPPGQPADLAPPFVIVIMGADGAELLKMTERHGRLHVEGDESRWTEATVRFVYAMMEWSGQVGIGWRDAATRSVEGR